jgi:hypothetical protein
MLENRKNIRDCLVEVSNESATRYHVKFTARRTAMLAFCNSAVVPIENRIAFWLCHPWIMCPRVAGALLLVFQHCRDGARNPSLPIPYDLMRPTCRARWILHINTRRHEPTSGTKMWEDIFRTYSHATTILDFREEAARAVH